MVWGDLVVYLVLFSICPERITGGFGSDISQGMGFFSSCFTVSPLARVCKGAACYAAARKIGIYRRERPMCRSLRSLNFKHQFIGRDSSYFFQGQGLELGLGGRGAKGQEGVLQVMADKGYAKSLWLQDGKGV